MNKLAIIDGDALCYHSSKETLGESLVNIDEKINNIFIQTEATHYVIFLSYTPYFRHKIDPLYKSSRSKYTSTLKWLKTLKAYLKEKWNAQSMNDIESDDLCVYWYNKGICISEGRFETRESWDSVNCILAETGETPVSYVSVEKTLASPDKDLIDGASGTIFNYTYKLQDKDNPDSVIKGWWVRTPKEDVYINFWKSMVCGDATDGIKGIEGSGEAAFNKMLKVCQEELIPIEDMVLTAYKKKYGLSQGIFEFQKNYRLLHLLDCDEDFYREVGELPMFPEIQEVTLPKEEVKTEITDETF